jgi:hypothetical protein
MNEQYFWIEEKPKLPGYYWIRKWGNNDTRTTTCIMPEDILFNTVFYLGFREPMDSFEFCFIPTPNESAITNHELDS